MLIESIIRREKGTVVNLEEKTYHFRPNPDSPEDPRHVCEVKVQTHIARFLQIPEGYRLADEDEDEVLPEFLSTDPDNEDFSDGENGPEGEDPEGGDPDAGASSDGADEGIQAEAPPVKKAARKATPRKRNK